MTEEELADDVTEGGNFFHLRVISSLHNYDPPILGLAVPKKTHPARYAYKKAENYYFNGVFFITVGDNNVKRRCFLIEVIHRYGGVRLQSMERRIDEVRSR